MWVWKWSKNFPTTISQVKKNDLQKVDEKNIHPFTKNTRKIQQNPIIFKEFILAKLANQTWKKGQAAAKGCSVHGCWKTLILDALHW